MRKYVFLFALVCCCSFGYAENMEHFLNSFSSKAGVERVKIGPLVMKLSSMFTETMGVSSIEVLDLSECREEVKEKFRNGLRTIKDPEYEPLVTVNEDDETVRILVRIDDDLIRELVIATSDDEDHALIRIKGKIKPEDLGKIIEENQ